MLHCFNIFKAKFDVTDQIRCSCTKNKYLEINLLHRSSRRKPPTLTNSFNIKNLNYLPRDVFLSGQLFPQDYLSPGVFSPWYVIYPVFIVHRKILSLGKFGSSDITSQDILTRDIFSLGIFCMRMFLYKSHKKTHAGLPVTRTSPEPVLGVNLHVWRNVAFPSKITVSYYSQESKKTIEFNNCFSVGARTVVNKLIKFLLNFTTIIVACCLPA